MPRQKLGQHFLASDKILDQIARAACGDSTPLTVEIGPGKGALTAHLLRHSARVVAIELDHLLADHLRVRWPSDSRLDIVEGDALQTDWGLWGDAVLAGNLPYYVATPIISRYVREPGPIRHAVFLIQKEVAERIAAVPGGREYGYFSVECQLLARPEYLFTVPPAAFRPPPKVDSAVVKLTPLPRPAGLDIPAFLKFVSACFRQKRKTLRNNLAGICPRETLETLPGTGGRAEQLGISEFLALYAAVASQRRSHGP